MLNTRNLIGRRAIITRASKPRVDLLQAVTRHIQKETAPWVSDLVLPLLTDDTGSLTPPPETVDPSLLADSDSNFIYVDGIRVHYKERFYGTPSETLPTVLLCHGFNGSTFSWRYTLDAFQETNNVPCRVIAFDRPPFGLTERPLNWERQVGYNPYTGEGNARMAEALLGALNIRGPLMLVGHSAGAITAMELYKRCPHRIAGIVLVAPAVPASKEYSFTRKITLGGQLRFLITRALLSSDYTGLRYIRRQILKRRDAVARGEVGARFSENAVLSPPDVIEGYLRPLRSHGWDKGALDNFRSFSVPKSYDAEYESLVGVPVLILQGDKDVGLLQNAKGLATKIPSSRYVELEDCGHMPMEEKVSEFNGHFTHFIASILTSN